MNHGVRGGYIYAIREAAAPQLQHLALNRFEQRKRAVTRALPERKQPAFFGFHFFFALGGEGGAGGEVTVGVWG